MGMATDPDWEDQETELKSHTAQSRCSRKELFECYGEKKVLVENGGTGMEFFQKQK